MSDLYGEQYLSEQGELFIEALERGLSMDRRKSPCKQNTLNTLDVCDTCHKKDKCSKYPAVQWVRKMQEKNGIITVKKGGEGGKKHVL